MFSPLVCSPKTKRCLLLFPLCQLLLLLDLNIIKNRKKIAKNKLQRRKTEYKFQRIKKTKSIETLQVEKLYNETYHFSFQLL